MYLSYSFEGSLKCNFLVLNKTYCITSSKPSLVLISISLLDLQALQQMYMHQQLDVIYMLTFLELSLKTTSKKSTGTLSDCLYIIKVGQSPVLQRIVDSQLSQGYGLQLICRTLTN